MIYQVTPALLDALVLAVIDEEEAYGYMIAQQIKELAVQKESALYPVLKRLLAAEELVAYNQEYQGRNRKYYRITEEGRAHLELCRREWADFKDAADKIMYGGKEDGAQSISQGTGEGA